MFCHCAQWLKETFLQYLTKWEEEVNTYTALTPIERERMLLSKETRDGLKMTSKSNRVTWKPLYLRGARFITYCSTGIY